MAGTAASCERAGALARQVRAVAGADARLFAIRAPGRVNLIGEHTDYSGLPVLPVAIDRATIIVAAANASREIEIRNADSAYPARRFQIERKIPPYPDADWGNYVKAAVQGVIDHFDTRGAGVARFRGATMAVDSRVPPAAGVSSSAALTVASTLACMAVNALELPPIETAAMVARSEWYVGTRAGGMDQAASLLGRRHHALFIEFEPLRVRAVRMPAEAALLVADSREVADKSGKVRAEYNRRVVECALAARILARALKLDGVRILGDAVRKLDRKFEPMSEHRFDQAAADNLVRTLAASAPAELRRRFGRSGGNPPGSARATRRPSCSELARTESCWTSSGRWSASPRASRARRDRAGGSRGGGAGGRASRRDGRADERLAREPRGGLCLQHLAS